MYGGMLPFREAVPPFVEAVSPFAEAVSPFVEAVLTHPGAGSSRSTWRSSLPCYASKVLAPAYCPTPPIRPSARLLSYAPETP